MTMIQNRREAKIEQNMEFINGHELGFIVTKYVPLENGSIKCFFQCFLSPDTDDGAPSNSVEIEVVVKPPIGATLQEIEQSARKQARLLLETAAKVVESPTS